MICLPFFLFGDVGLEDFFMDFFLDGERRYDTVLLYLQYCTVVGMIVYRHAYYCTVNKKLFKAKTARAKRCRRDYA